MSVMISIGEKGKKGLTSDVLKLIAIISMTIDQFIFSFVYILGAILTK